MRALLLSFALLQCCLFSYGQQCTNDNPINAQGVSDSDRRIILDTHNHFRDLIAAGGVQAYDGALPSASNMAKLVWDDNLAAAAQNHASRCVYEHYKPDPEKYGDKYGQNLYKGSNSGAYGPADWKKAITKWYSEVDKFPVENRSPFLFFHGAGHFSQVVWAETTKVGCGFAQYTDSSNRYPNQGLYTCNYSPTFPNVTLEEELRLESMQELLGATQRPEYDTTKEPSSTNPDWMSQVPDSTKLTALSIPGTHNTMALYGGPWAQCQTWSLIDIYKSGVRFADIRCRFFNDGLPIHHELIYQKTGFGTVLQETLKFLNENPTETVLMRIRQEYKPENNTKNFEDVVSEYLNKFMPENRLWDQSYMPSLGEARGKLIILRDYNDWRWVRYRNLDIDDKWDVKSLFHVGAKWESVQQHLDRAMQGSDDVGYLTFSSGSSAFAFPSGVASRINKKLWDYTQEKPGKLRWGIIAMDYPGVDLIQAIIKSNF